MNDKNFEKQRTNMVEEQLKPKGIKDKRVQVFTIERHQKLTVQAKLIFEKLGYHNIKSKVGDGTKDWQEEAPFQAILVSAAAPGIPKALSQQLAAGGKMVIPIGGKKDIQKLISLTKEDEHNLEVAELEYVRFVPLIGDYSWD